MLLRSLLRVEFGVDDLGHDGWPLLPLPAGGNPPQPKPAPGWLVPGNASRIQRIPPSARLLMLQSLRRRRTKDTPKSSPAYNSKTGEFLRSAVAADITEPAKSIPQSGLEPIEELSKVDFL